MIALLPYSIRKIERIEYLVSDLALRPQLIRRLDLPPECGTGDRRPGCPQRQLENAYLVIWGVIYPLKIFVPLLSIILAFMPHRAIQVAAINLS